MADTATTTTAAAASNNNYYHSHNIYGDTSDELVTDAAPATTAPPNVATTAPPNVTAPPSSNSSSYWRIVFGSNVCQLSDNGRCVTDGPGSYGNYERCEVQALRDLTVTAQQYDNEDFYDYVTVDGVRHRYAFPAQGVSMNKGAALVWTSDGSVRRAGYTLCAG